MSSFAHNSKNAISLSEVELGGLKINQPLFGAEVLALIFLIENFS